MTEDPDATAARFSTECIIWKRGEARGMQGLRKILRALAIVIFPMVGAVIVYGSSSGMETAIGLFLILFAVGLMVTWFW